MTDASRGTAKAAATLRAYHSDWTGFCEWARAHGLDTLPAAPRTLTLYLTEMAGAAKVATIGRRLSAIAHAHRAAQVPSPTDDAGVRALWATIRRGHGGQVQGTAPIAPHLLQRMVDALPGRLIGARDRALLLVGFAAGLRRSELVGLDVEDVVTHGPDGLVRLGGGGEVELAPVPHLRIAPVEAVAAWREAAALHTGPLFRPIDRHGRVGTARLTASAVGRIVQRAAAGAGADPGRYSAQSLRAGWTKFVAGQTG
ncbi:MAG TPA: hypothetical protein VM942_06375 [Acidimicrobiales bacterium]|nr:hypothetical protein [Acidimicrobiales bacterium]